VPGFSVEQMSEFMGYSKGDIESEDQDQTE